MTVLLFTLQAAAIVFIGSLYGYLRTDKFAGKQIRERGWVSHQTRWDKNMFLVLHLLSLAALLAATVILMVQTATGRI